MLEVRKFSAPMVSLQRCISGLPLKQVETDGAGFRAPTAHAMPDGFLGVLRPEGFEFGLGLLMLKESRSGEPEAAGEFCPGVGETHIGDPHRLDPRPRRLDPEKVRGLASLHAAPELLLSR